MRCSTIQKDKGGEQALQKRHSHPIPDRRIQDAEARAWGLRIQLDTSQHEYLELQQSLQALQAEKRDLQIELSAAQDAFQESQQSLQESLAEQRYLQSKLEDSQDAYQESEQSLEASLAGQSYLQSKLEASQKAYEESQLFLEASQVEKRDLQLQLEGLQDACHGSQQSLQESRAEKQILQQSVDEANAQPEAHQRRVQDAERRAEEAERRACDARQRASEGEPSWVVQRDEINLTETELGRGAWAVVRVAEFRGVHCAAKCLHRQIVSHYNRVLFTREMNMASQVRHPNLLQFIGATLQGELIILTELMTTSVRGELQIEHTFSHNQIISINLDVARALNYLHLMQPSPIIHRDISSANVLLEPGPSNGWRAKVSDYGSVNLVERLRTAAPGNPTYAAPEVENTTLQSPKMDIFSFGVLLVEMCSAQFPAVDDRERLIHSIQHPGMVALIRQCLSEDRNARPSARAIVTELSAMLS